MRIRLRQKAFAPALLLVLDARLLAAAPVVPEVRAVRVHGAIALDGRVAELAWREAGRVVEWFETSPGDNAPPRVETVAYLAYDGRALYVAFECRDPEPGRIRSALGDRDAYGLSDAVGVMIDTQGERKTASEFWVNAGGSQFDGILDDVSEVEDPAPDFHWESAVRVDDRGWAAEMRIPFSALRYSERSPETWGLILQRNYPREFFYQISSTTLPRGASCFVCRSASLRGLESLPSAGRIVLAPYVSGRQTTAPGTRREREGDLGLDLKWAPHPGHSLDVTWNPDFSQVEADAAQIDANERFALFYPEKRPFFLEGRDLLSTPIQAVSTRSVTAPAWGGRATGRVGSLAYAVLAARDDGGGSVILPGPEGSTLAPQDFQSLALVGRLRAHFKDGFAGFLATDRETDGGGSNRVYGPDVQWRPSASDVVTGQLLFSSSRTPRREDLAAEWDGRELSGHAAGLRWRHSGARLDWTADVKDVADGFRADVGFVPQVGFRSLDGEAGWTSYPEGWLRQLRLFACGERSTRRDGSLLGSTVSIGATVRGRWSSSATARVDSDRVLSGGVVLPRTRALLNVTVRPLRVLSEVSLAGSAGEAIDFENHRPGHGVDLSLSASVRPTRHLELKPSLGWRSLEVGAPSGKSRRLLTATVARLLATYHVTPNVFVRVVGQSLETRREVALYDGVARPRSASTSASVLLAHRLNWQTAVVAGYGDERALSGEDRLEPGRRTLFLKLSYAFRG